MTACTTLCTLVLKDSHSFWIQGTECLALGHEQTTGDAYNPFYGANLARINAEESPGYDEGIIFLNPAGPHRDPSTLQAIRLNCLATTLTIDGSDSMGTTQDRNRMGTHMEPEQPPSSSNSQHNEWRDEDILQHFQQQRNHIHTEGRSRESAQGHNPTPHRNSTMVQ
eukprot:13421526-Heterocapsa_arctica.AAC.1